MQLQSLDGKLTYILIYAQWAIQTDYLDTYSEIGRTVISMGNSDEMISGWPLYLTLYLKYYLNDGFVKPKSDPDNE